MSKISKRPTILMPTADEDKTITAAVQSDLGTAAYAKATQVRGSNSGVG
jgi:hypothetical protein